ncbi:hypothetical protein [Hyphomicrobium sp. CS1GBMeth3]|uniref:hypothetical protein n=1 Tax=Hyphomicrobium sp. CS1GBMeth3 TaxID=1892845 RepID=UPI00093120D9|nr:hypothetical protein [Hyphomicrobium sp. CS1GBMeth3]
MTIPHTAQQVVYRRCFTALAGLAAALALMLPVSAGAETAKCVTKHGSATGLTRGFAEYEAFLIIRQVTGNWPFQQDQISEPKYKCKGEGVMWTCSATAEVCRG